MAGKIIKDLPFEEINKIAEQDKTKENAVLVEQKKEVKTRARPKKISNEMEEGLKPSLPQEIKIDASGQRYLTIDDRDEEKDNTNNFIGAENKIEYALKAAQAPKSEIEAITDAQLQIHAEKTNITDKFLASKIQKTEVRKDHRVVIPIMNMLAKKPFPNIACHIVDPERKEEIENEFTIDYLSDFIEGFIEYGIPVDRKGRKEEVEVLSAYLRQQEQGVQMDTKNRGYK